MFGIFKKKNRFLVSCMRDIAIPIADEFGRNDADQIAGYFCNDYHILYETPLNAGLEGFDAIFS